MAYGQTSSGKTSSMCGKDWAEETLKESADSPLSKPGHSELHMGSGVVPRSIHDLFSELDNLASQSSEDFDFSVHCQILQIYNERIYDLLQDKKRENPLSLREAPGKGQKRNDASSVHIPGMSVFRVHSRDDVMNLLKKGVKNRPLVLPTSMQSRHVVTRFCSYL